VTTEPKSVRLGLAVIAACATAAGLYGILRVVQSLLFKEADPALVIWSEHAGFFWRALTVGYVGGMAGFVTWWLSARHAGRVARVLVRVVLIAAGLLAAQGVLVP
jgi:hypothetical protein